MEILLEEGRGYFIPKKIGMTENLKINQNLKFKNSLKIGRSGLLLFNLLSQMEL